MNRWIVTGLMCGFAAISILFGQHVLLPAARAANRNEEFRKEMQTRTATEIETDACRTALPEAKDPKPVWRSCSRFEKCFHCVDDRGVLHPVRPPHCGPNQSCQ